MIVQMKPKLMHTLSIVVPAGIWMTRACFRILSGRGWRKKNRAWHYAMSSSEMEYGIYGNSGIVTCKWVAALLSELCTAKVLMGLENLSTVRNEELSVICRVLWVGNLIIRANYIVECSQFHVMGWLIINFYHDTLQQVHIQLNS